MKRVVHKITYTIFLIFLFCALLAVDFVSTAKSVLSVSAEETEVVNYDETDISDDLKDLDITQYPKNEKGKHELVLFMEYCYSVRPFLAEEYGLYLYVYNPTEKAIKTASTNNVANMATAYNASGEPSAYSNVSLLCLDQTDNNRFFKFKVMDSASFLTRAKAYATAHDGKRRYDVAGIQLVYSDGSLINVNDETVGKTYTYTGFAAGCDSAGGEESTLKCEVKGFKTLYLDVHPTQWQPEGYSDPDTFAKDSLHSVYFSIPNDMIETYGELVALRGTFLNALLKPALVTGNKVAYAAIKPFLGKDIGDHTDDLNYMYLGEADNTNAYQFSCDISYNAAEYMPLDGFVDVGYGEVFSAERLSTLYFMFNAGNGENSAKNYTVSSESIKNKMLTSWADFGGDRIDGAEGDYSSKVFESIDEELSTFYIKRDDEYSLLDIGISQNFWQDLFGWHTVEYSNAFNGIKAIEKVTEDDLKKDEADIASELYISERDVPDFFDYCEESMNENDSTVYIFRYRKSTYNVYTASCFQLDTFLVDSWYKIDDNAYFFQEHVDLNFDIIEATFTLDGVDTVIAVVADPLDIFPAAEPPPQEKCECIPIFNCDCEWDCTCECWGIGCVKWRWIAGGIGLILLIPVINIVTYPFRLLFRASGKISERERKTRKKK